MTEVAFLVCFLITMALLVTMIQYHKKVPKDVAPQFIIGAVICFILLCSITAHWAESYVNYKIQQAYSETQQTVVEDEV